MNTAETLVRMTDRVQYERLATSIVRLVDQDCLSMIHAGVNVGPRLGCS